MVNLDTQEGIMTNWIIDIDGTICEDIPNEESHRYKHAKALPGAKEWVNSLVAKGDAITFFTARENKDREVTIEWLQQQGFVFHRLIMEKPRGGDYVWVDNLRVKGIQWTSGTYPNSPLFS
jgi:predicted secreted acid phosphatase